MRATVRRRTGIAGMLAGMLALGVSGTVASGADDALRQAVESRLADEAAVAGRVEVAARGGEVTLAGALATLWDKEWALDRARKTDGVRAVVSELVVVSPETDRELGNAVGQAILRYPYYSVFDYVDVTVEDGVVTLRGDVTARPDKPADLYERISKVRGVQAIVDCLDVLPPGIGDERLRRRLARELFGHPQFDRYLGLAPRLSIIVRNGYVTLKGVVYDQADRILAESIARRSYGVVRVRNELQTRQELLDASADATAGPAGAGGSPDPGPCDPQAGHSPVAGGRRPATERPSPR